jgi:SAM-dependent methyltransferase
MWREKYCTHGMASAGIRAVGIACWEILVSTGGGEGMGEEASARQSYMNYMTESELWRAKITGWLGVEARLIHVSSLSSDVRIYRLGTRILKVRRLTPASISNRPGTLEDEFHLLRRLNLRGEMFCGIPVATRYFYEPEWEALEMTAIEPPAVYDPIVSPAKETITGLFALVRAVWRLNRAGVSHGDLTTTNAGSNKAGRIVLLDFDQAVVSHPVRCFLRDMWGFPCASRAAQFTIWDRFGELGLIAPLFRCVQWVRSRLGRRRFNKGRLTDNLYARAVARGDVRLQRLAECWREAAASGANSPDSEVAYYSFDLAGMHFPGERPWTLRWETISRKVSFRGKRVVELGCNLGLLSIQACLAGAETVVAADHNQRILAAAAKAAALFGAEVIFRQIDFDKDADWESSLGTGDLVSALSLTYWLRDKERLWRYLARFPEVVFEGHEPAEEIELRLRAHGFTVIERLGVSERNRVIFHAMRRIPPS